MELKLQKLEYFNFRNYEQYSLSDIEGITLFIGDNAVGKTNLIEGIQLMTAIASFRNPKTEHLIRFGQDVGRIETIIGDDKRKLTIELLLQANKKQYRLNKKPKQAKSLKGILPAIIFSPDDLQFIKGSQSIKRVELDNLGSQLSKNYHAVKRDYEKILKQKNFYLKDEITSNYLESVNEVLVTIGSQLYYLRSKLVQELIPYFQKYYQELSEGKEKVEISYIPSWIKYEKELNPYCDSLFVSREEAKKSLFDILEKEGYREYQRHQALFGPHADQIIFFLNGKDASLFASQGQQRSLVLSYKMAEVELIKDKLNQTPILLLDDVMSELDERRRMQLIDLITHDIQTFITSTNLSYFKRHFLETANVIKL